MNDIKKKAGAIGRKHRQNFCHPKECDGTIRLRIGDKCNCYSLIELFSDLDSDMDKWTDPKSGATLSTYQKNRIKSMLRDYDCFDAGKCDDENRRIIKKVVLDKDSIVVKRYEDSYRLYLSPKHRLVVKREPKVDRSEPEFERQISAGMPGIMIDQQHEAMIHQFVYINMKNVAAKPYFYYEDAGYRYYTMSFINGTTCAERVKVASLNIGKIVEKIKRLHQGGILHLDLHDENIIRTESGEYYIIDYGWSMPTKKFAELAAATYEPFATIDPKVWGVIDLFFIYIKTGWKHREFIDAAKELHPGMTRKVMNAMFDFWWHYALPFHKWWNYLIINDHFKYTDGAREHLKKCYHMLVRD